MVTVRSIVRAIQDMNVCVSTKLDGDLVEFEGYIVVMDSDSWTFKTPQESMAFRTMHELRLILKTVFPKQSISKHWDSFVLAMRLVFGMKVQKSRYCSGYFFEYKGRGCGITFGGDVVHVYTLQGNERTYRIGNLEEALIDVKKEFDGRKGKSLAQKLSNYKRRRALRRETRLMMRNETPSNDAQKGIVLNYDTEPDDS